MNSLRALPLLAAAAAASFAGGCTPDSAPIIDAGGGLVLDSGTGGDQGGDGDTCDEAIRISASGEFTGDTTGKGDDASLACGFEAAPDMVYRLDLTEVSGVRATVSGYDAIIALVDDTCTFDAEGTHELACTDSADPEAAESFSIGSLAAGTYFIVLDGYDGAAGAYTLDVEIVAGGFCAGDDFDGAAGEDNDVPARAVGAGAGDLTTKDDPATTDVDETLPLAICEGDTDMFLIGHMGGALTVAVDGADAALNVAEYTTDLDALAATVTGAGATSPLTGDHSRGLYLLTVTKASPGTLGAAYGLDVTHACQPDGLDDPVPAIDVASDVFEGPGLLEPLEAADERTVCADDVDTFVVTNILQGDVTFTLTGGATLGVSLVRVDVAGDVETEVPLVAATDYTTVVSGANLTVTIPNAAAAKFKLSVDAGDAPSPTAIEYGFNVAFAAIAAPPANDLCAGRETLTPAATPTPLFGRTLGATDDFISPCGGDTDAAEADPAVEGAPEVFYSFHLDATTDVIVRFDGTRTDFEGAVTLLRFPGTTCPADVNTLAPVEFASTPLCRTGDEIALRAPDLEAGDYLVVVDGTYFNFFGLIELRSKGAFDVSVETYAAGLPVPAACTAATALPIPAIGATSTVQLSYDATSPNEIDFYSEVCSPSHGGAGGEKIYTLVPTENVKLKVTTDGYDTLASIVQGDCGGYGFVACNDDIDDTAANYNSSVEATLSAGVTYHLVIDAYAALDPDDTARTTTLTVESSAP